MKFQKMKIDPPRLYWTSRATNFDKEIWYEKSPGCCGSMWFPYAEKFMTRFPWLAVRTFWVLIKLTEAWDMFLTNYPSPYPDLLKKDKKFVVPEGWVVVYNDPVDDAVCEWYVWRKDINMMLWKDGLLHNGGYSGWENHSYGETPGYWPTKEAAEAALEQYLEKTPSPPKFT